MFFLKKTKTMQVLVVVRKCQKSMYKMRNLPQCVIARGFTFSAIPKQLAFNRSACLQPQNTYHGCNMFVGDLWACMAYAYEYESHEFQMYNYRILCVSIYLRYLVDSL